MADDGYDLRVLLTRALRRIQELEARPQHEPIAVIGMGCRFPGGADSPRQFWELLSSDRGAIVEVPETRWPVADSAPRRARRRAGLLAGPIDAMDTEFLGIAPREAASMDPQQRLVLEVAWEAMEDAALAPDGPAAARTGVFLGVSWQEYQRTITPDWVSSVDAHTLTGTMSSIVAGRVSYVLGLRGPAVAIDTACSSSLVAVHQACRSLRAGECEVALAGGVNLLQSELTSEALARMGALSPDGHCRPFDARANGYVRGEGAGVIVLKPLSRALADGDPIRALIRGSSVNHDGRSMGLTAPNPTAQRELLRDALADAGCAAEQVGYVETHGTGTPLGDPIEIEALSQVLGTPRADGSVCLLGSVKSQIGHLEAAAGVAGLIKAVLQLEHERIPRQHDFATMNPKIVLDGTALAVPNQDVAWPRTDRPRLAGVSSFGFAGTNAHVLLEQAPESAPTVDPREPALLVLSARTSSALDALSRRYVQHLDQRQLPLADIAATAALGRSHFGHRRAVVAPTTAEAARRLAGPSGRSTDSSSGKPRVAMLFTGQGAQYAGMGAALDRGYPVFRAALDRCDDLLGPLPGGMRLRSVLFDANDEVLTRTEYAQPALFAIEWACAELWAACGVRPDIVLGHSLGELVAATVAGVLDLEAGLRLAAERGRLMQSVTRQGAMAAVFGKPEEFDGLLGALTSDVAVAAVNGPGQFVVSGTVEAVRRILQDAAERSVRTVMLSGSTAFHSPLLDPILDEFEARVAELVPAPRPAAIPLVSNVTGMRTEARVDAAYWRAHARGTVRFADGVRSVADFGVDAYLEVGPHPVLLEFGRQADPDALWVPSMRRTSTDDEVLLTGLGEMYCAGADIDWSSVVPREARRRNGLPTYPFERERVTVPIAGTSSNTGYLAEHRFQGRAVVPAAYLALRALRAAGEADRELVDFVAARPVPLEELADPVVSGADGRIDVRFQVDEGVVTAVSGSVQAATSNRPRDSDELTEARRAPSTVWEVADFYRRCADAGLTFGPRFRWITRLQVTDNSVLAELTRPAELAGEPDAALPCLLDAAVQTGLALAVRHSHAAQLPVGIGRLRLSGADAAAKAWALAERTGRTIRITVFDTADAVVCEIDDVWFAESAAAGQSEDRDLASGLVHRPSWVPAATSASGRGPGAALVVGVGQQADRLAAALRAAGTDAVAVERTTDPAVWPDDDRAVVYLADVEADDSADTARTETQFAMGVVQAMARVTSAGPLYLVTVGATGALPGERVRPAAATLWGLGAVVRTELPELGCRLIDLPIGARCDDRRLVDELCSDATDSALALRGRHRYVPRMGPFDNAGGVPRLDRDAAYLITGGRGALGLTAARTLAEAGAGAVVLAGRSAPDARAEREMARIAAPGTRVETATVDVADRNALSGLLARFGSEYPRLAGVVHCAGVLDDAMLIEQTSGHVERVFGGKVAGAWHLHELTAERSLDLFVLFSSVSATVGTAGQGNYAAANAYLDALVRLRLAEGLPAVGIAWGPWAGIGMAGGLSDAARRAWARHGVAELGAEDGARVLRRLLSSEGVVAVYPTAAAASARPEAVADADEKNMESPRDPAELLELVRGHAMTALGRTATVSDRTPLRDLGLDSMMAVELRNALSAELGVRLPATLLFDHPTVAAVSEEIARRGARSARNGGDPRRAAREQAEQRPVTRTSEQLTSSVYPTEPPATPSNYNVLQLTEREPGATPEDYADAIAIIGMGCRYPGDVGGPADLWHLLTTETDAVTEVPAHRWDADAYFDPDPDAEGKTYTRWGGFVDGVEEFDAGFFDISVGEARMLDPQQRLLLETSWEALEHAGYPASRLEGSRTGVFVGLMSNDYAERMARADLAPNAWFGTGNLSSVASGRLSYFFGANGPSLTVDTACSSSLVTVHTAVRSLRSGECDLALAGGATVVLTPSLDIYFARARGLAADGRCKSFDARADGVVWSDGAGVLVLKRLADARRDGDRVLGLVRGSAVNSDGRSQGLSAPNGPAQERVVRAALADAAVEAAEIDYVETHGTGTALGDPIEVNALASVLGDGRTEAAPLWIGSVKSNLGHTQAAAGIANIIKVIESMRHERIPASLHFRSGNPHIDWDSVAVRVVAEERSWRRSGRPRRAGVSAFGISGTNAHVVIEEAPPVLEAHPVDHSGPHLLVLSAKSADALRELAARYRDFVAAHPEIGLADVCASAALGRTHFDERVAITFDTAAQVRAALDNVASGMTASGSVADPAESGAAGDLARRYVSGAEIDWGEVYSGRSRRHVDLPTYPFQRKRHWLELASRPDAAPSSRTLRIAPEMFAGHRLRGVPTVPAAWLCTQLSDIAAELPGTWAVTQLRLVTPFEVTTEGSVRVTLDPGSDGYGVRFVRADGTSIADAKLAVAEAVSSDRPDEGAALPDADAGVWPAYYEKLARLGLHLDADHRCAIEFRRISDTEAEAVFRLPEHDPATLDPILLDACLHSVVLTGASADALFLPSAIDRAQLFGRPTVGDTTVGCRVRVIERGGRVVVGDATLRSASGRLLARLTGVCLLAANTEAAPETGAADGDSSRLERLLHHVEWVPAEKDGPVPGESAGRWLIFSDGAVGDTVAAGLAARAAQTVVVRPEDIDGPASPIYSGTVDPSSVHGIIFAWTAAAAQTRIDAALRLARALDAAGRPPTALWLLTVNAQHVAAADRPDPDQALLWGFGRTLATEHPEFGCRLLDVSGESTDGALIAEGMLGGREAGEFAIRDGRWLVARLAKGPAPAEDYRLVAHRSGEFDRLRLDSGARRAPGAGEVEIAVAATGLNAHDIWVAAGLHPDAAAALGSECAGRIVAVGAGVEGLAVGDRVVALASGSFAGYVTVDQRLVASLPGHLSFAEGATIPVAFTTAWYALFDVGALRAGDRVLVHAPADGIGMAAVQLAAHAGAQVFATAALRRWADNAGLNVTPIETWRDHELAEHVQVATAGRGLDVVVHALGSDIAAPGSEIVCAGGRFVNVIDPMQTRVSRHHDLDHREFDPAAVDPQRLGAILRTVMALFEQAALHALPHATHGIDQAAKAFRAMAQRHHPGRVVLLGRDARPAAIGRNDRLTDGTYLVTGGFGGLGAAAARWLAARGAGHLVLVGRRAPDAAGSRLLESLRASGVRVAARQADVSDRAAVAALLRSIEQTGFPPLRGVVHCAGVLDDGVVTEQSWSRFETVLGPKYHAARHLDELTRDQPLDLFVAYSSVAGVLGTPGQANYAAANAALDALAWRRRAEGLPALSIAWGPFADVGMAADRTDIAARLTRRGLPPLYERDAATALDHLVRLDSTTPGVFDFVPQRWYTNPRRLVTASTTTVPATSAAIARGISRQPTTVPQSRASNDSAAWETIVQRVAMRVLDRGSELDPDLPLHDTGVDSLTGMELRAALAAEIGMPLPAGLVFDYPTVRDIARFLQRKGAPAPTTGAEATGPGGVPAVESAVGESTVSGALKPPRPATPGSLISATTEPVSAAAEAPISATASPMPAAAEPPVWATPEPPISAAPERTMSAAPERTISAAPEPSVSFGAENPAWARASEPEAIARAVPTEVASDDSDELETDDPIVIVGMSCRFPGGVRTPEEFWELLWQGRDAITEVPSQRWDIDAYYDPDPAALGTMYTRWGGFVDGADEFDPAFFGIGAAEARAMDPQQRMLLETSWEALERSGRAPGGLAGSSTGVFVGLCFSEYPGTPAQATDPATIGAYSVIGSAPSVAAGRLAYALGLQGPAVTLDTACSSSLVALQSAADGLRAGRCDLALVGGVNLQLAPETTIGFCRLASLSPDGRSRAFDADANGYVRADGCGVLVLTRLSEARRNGDQVLAVVRGVAVNHDGRSNGLTAPNGPAQQRVIADALARAGVRPDAVDYVETHGTGTPLGDPIEATALAEVYGAGRMRPLLIGSVKTNIGHTEGAAGVAGVIKAVLMLQHGRIPPSLHFHTPNPLIDWAGMPLEVVREAREWPRTGNEPTIGVSSFGMSGTNAHVILAQGDPTLVRQPDTPTAQVLVLSARNEAALTAAAQHWADETSSARGDFGDLAYTSATARTHFEERLAVVAETGAVAARRLRDKPMIRGRVERAATPKVALLFTGQGAQYRGMARELFDTEPVFHDALRRCDAVLGPIEDGIGLLDALYGDHDDADLLRRTVFTQPTLFAVEWALWELWRAWGITPYAVLGHSVGEYVAACAAGAMTMEDALRLIAVRGRLMQRLPDGGGMLAVDASAEQVAPLMARCGPAVSIAGYNGPAQVVVAGPRSALDLLRDDLSTSGIRATALTVSHAFHSAAMDPILDDLAAAAARTPMTDPVIPLVSNLTGAPLHAGELTPDYWIRHARRPVRFAQSMHAMAELGMDTFLELGPQPTLSTLGGRVLGDSARFAASLRRGRGDRETLMTALAQLYVRGVPVDWEQVHRPHSRRKVLAPTYPFQRQRYWVEPRADAPAVSASTRRGLPVRNDRSGGAIEFDLTLGPDRPRYLADHVVDRDVVVPGAWFVATIAAAAHEVAAGAVVAIDDLVITSGLTLTGPQPVRVRFEPSTEGFAVLVTAETDEGPRTHARARVLAGQHRLPAGPDRADILGRCPDHLAGADFYALLATAGLPYGPAFRRVVDVRVGAREALVRLSDPDTDAGPGMVHPALLDAAFQATYAAMSPRAGDHTWVPFAVDRVLVPAGAGTVRFGHVRVVEQTPQLCVADVRLLDEEGRPVLVAEGLRVMRTPTPDPTQRPPGHTAQDRFASDVYRIAWRDAESALSGAAAGRWLVFGAGGFADTLAEALRARGADCVLARPGRGFAFRAEDEFEVDLGVPAAVRALLGAVSDGRTPLRGIVSTVALSPDDAPAPVRAESLLVGALHLVQAAALAGEPAVWVLTRAGQRVDPSDRVAPEQSALWGFARSAQLEHREMGCRVIDLDQQATADAVVDTLVAPSGPRQLALRAGRRWVPRLVPLGALGGGAATLSGVGGTVLITGGLGGVGLLLARWLVDRGWPELVLAGRSAPDAQAESVIAELRGRGARISVRSLDVSDRDAVAATLEWIDRALPPLAGVVHLAGVLDDGVVAEQTAARVGRVLAPKTFGAWHLHELTASRSLRFFVLFSSAAGVVGLPGQSSYGAANAFLDGLAELRHAAGAPALSIAWGPWADTGMMGRLTSGAVRRLAERGYGLSDHERDFETLSHLLDSAMAGAVTALALLLPAVQEAGPDAPDVLLDVVAPVPPSIENHSATADVTGLAAEMEALVRRCLGLGSDTDLDRPLHELGLDSVAALEIRDELSRKSGHRLPATLAFEYPTPRAVLDLLVQLGTTRAPAPPSTEVHGDSPLRAAARTPAPATNGAPNHRQLRNEPATNGAAGHRRLGNEASQQRTPEPPSNQRPAATDRASADSATFHAAPGSVTGSGSGHHVEAVGDIAIVGVSGRYPGADGLDEYWRVLLEGRDCITEIPLERWDHSRYFVPDRHNPYTSYTKWGGFLDDVDCFDPLFFAISPREAEVLDPQERLFLQTAWAALEDAGHTRADLARGGLRPEEAGVFVGVMWGTYQMFGAEESRLGRGTLPGSTFWSIPNRVSHALDFQGPSIAVDTACSSSLTALHLACQSLRTGECRLAVVGGVNLSLHPYKFVALSQGQFASTDGRCRSFGVGGDGYVAGEGVGAMVLRPLADAEADGDTIYGVIKGTAVNHGGRVNGFTVPNPAVQAAVIRSALRAGGVDPASVSYIEAHGTGTALGDPIEIAGLAKVFGDTGVAQLPIGSVKSNVGHLEAAAGVAALTKVLLQLRHETIVPSLHATPANPNIDFAATPFRIPTSPLPWPSGDPARPRRATVSSFGAGGANANVVIEEYVDRRPQTRFSGGQVVPVSARDSDRLVDYVAALDRFLAGQQPNLADLAYTMQVGRQPGRARAAFVARDIDQLRAAVRAWVDDVPGARGCRDAAEDSRLARWLGGGDIDWGAVRDPGTRRRIPAPTYPFARERYWIPDVAPVPESTPAQLVHATPTTSVQAQPVQSTPVHPSAPATESAPVRQPARPASMHQPTPIPLPTLTAQSATVQQPPSAQPAFTAQPAPTAGPAPTTQPAALQQPAPAAGPGTARQLAWTDRRLLVPVWRELPLPAGDLRSRRTLVVYDARTSHALVEALTAATGDPGRLIRVSEAPVELHRDDFDAGARLGRGSMARYPDTDCVIDLCDLAPAPGGLLTGDLGRMGFYQGVIEARADSLALIHLTAGHPGADGPESAPLGGLAAALAEEIRGVRTRSVHLVAEHDAAGADAARLLEILGAECAADDGAPRVRYRGGVREAVEFEDAIARDGLVIDPARTYVVTGGTRGLGAEFAAALVERGARRLAILGREPLPPETEWDRVAAGSGPEADKVRRLVTLRDRGVAMRTYFGSLADEAALTGFFGQVRRELGPIGGVLHCAGSVSTESPAFVRKTGPAVATVLAPKLAGTAVLADVLAADRPDFFVLFSSVSAVLPGLAVGLSDYAMANAHLDRFAEAQHAAGRTWFRSINWPSFRDTGFGEVTSAAYRATGLPALTAAEGFDLLDAVLGLPGTPVVLPYHGAALHLSTRASQSAVAVRPAAPTPAAHPAPNGSGQAYEELLRIFSDELKLAPARFEGDKRFEEYGADSVLIASAVRRIEQVVGQPFDPALVLEFPTLDALAGLLIEQFPERFAAAPQPDSPHRPNAATTRRDDPVPPRAAATTWSADARRGRAAEPVAVVGIGCRLPGGDDPDSFWRMLAAGRSGIREVDPARWDPARFYRPTGGPGLANSKWGGFVDGIDLFDPDYFGVSDELAWQMDPLQRLLLETSVLATADAGYRREELAGKRVGVYAGSRAANYFNRIPVADRHTIIGIGQNFIAARISDYFDWHAGNVVLDSACSSSLLSVHLACQALRAGEVDAALAGGVEVLLDEMPFVTLSAAGVLSPNGRCATFSEDADGFVPGEGAALLLLKRFDDALADGDRIYAVLRGSAIGNDGHTMGITTPNMRAQIEVVTAALEAAGMSPDALSYLEAHGTGTMIGDPIELKGLATVLGDRSRGQEPCAVGSVKTNIGHLLSAAGIAGAVKTILAVHHAALPPSLHCDNLNPRFQFAGSPLQVNRALRPWRPADGRPRAAGVSSFGFGGTNAHLIVEQAPDGHRPTRRPLDPPVFRKRSFMLPKTVPSTPTELAPRFVVPMTPSVPAPSFLRVEPLR
ncbi:SDR family NAD(P)-dependent oxidoreductase [Nocardia sp. NBC_00508]|uniref:SDR family NAD(P)-dependent oxidoreductase n=1 Tax=Nocardia sp. NBC_00508 TaxID=2975992 RepID=UPI002E8030C1|nr:SDR family NAD(P)-dependent oxidoreductase [Nocardia sp. NBC_00508]WUD65829.1 SDR family NAD(P)-dependent oxidoreductase [Nocardia sp. NBC_00508]